MRFLLNRKILRFLKKGVPYFIISLGIFSLPLFYFYNEARGCDNLQKIYEEVLLLIENEKLQVRFSGNTVVYDHGKKTPKNARQIAKEQELKELRMEAAQIRAKKMECYMGTPLRL